MTEFSTSALLEVSLDNRSLRSARQRLEKELAIDPITIEVEAESPAIETDSARPTGSISPQSSREGGSSGRQRRRNRREHRWDRIRTETLDDIHEVLVSADSDGSGGGVLDEILGAGAAGGLLGVGGAAGGAIGSGLGAGLAGLGIGIGGGAFAAGVGEGLGDTLSGTGDFASGVGEGLGDTLSGTGDFASGVGEGLGSTLTGVGDIADSLTPEDVEFSPAFEPEFNPELNPEFEISPEVSPDVDVSPETDFTLFGDNGLSSLEEPDWAPITVLEPEWAPLPVEEPDPIDMEVTVGVGGSDVGLPDDVAREPQYPWEGLPGYDFVRGLSNWAGSDEPGLEPEDWGRTPTDTHAPLVTESVGGDGRAGTVSTRTVSTGTTIEHLEASVNVDAEVIVDRIDNVADAVSALESEIGSAFGELESDLNDLENRVETIESAF